MADELKRKHRILVSNDDGVHAPGIAALAKGLVDIAQVTVVAPDRDRSAASNSLTLDSPLRILEQPTGYFSVNGTPTDAVHLAITGWMADHPDMVVSGINHGANLGDDVIYSGTVAAATEGRFLGFPSIAFSLVCDNQEYKHFDAAAKVARLIVENSINGSLPKRAILNVNIPNLPFDQIKGFQVTRLGYRHIAEQVVASSDPRGHQIYWIGPAGPEEDGGEGTDFHAIKNGYVSITPIKIDLTDNTMMNELHHWSRQLSH